MAAKKTGVKTIIAGTNNRESIERVDPELRENIKILYVKDFLDSVKYLFHKN
ncbi:unnamed protein product [Meloidogyne enterolobii]|uniref:Uncharacterized protein n=1 Tax=Meloidogyne enterolobii TaxID=390850 RepID=A0ACB1ACN4_MELEN